VVDAGAYIAGNPDATQAEFARWVGSVRAMARYPELLGFGELVLVPAAELEAFAKRIAPDATLPRAADGTVQAIPRGERPFYCMVAASMQRPGGEAPAGFDFCAGNPAPLVARDSGRGSYEPIKIGESTTLGILTPVYRGGVVPATVPARRAAFVGWLGMSVAPRFVLESALAGHPGTAVQLRYRAGTSDAAFTAGKAPRGARSATIDLRNGWTVRTSATVAGGRIFDHGSALLALIGGVVLSVLLGLLDTARRRRARAQTEERVLRESEQRLGALLQHSSDMVTVVAVDGTVLYQAGSVHSVLGHTPSQLEGTKLTEWAGPDDVERLLALCETPQTAGAELDLRHADGSLRSCEVRATSLLDHPAWAGVVLNIRDVSDRKQLEIELRLAQKLESIGALAAGIAHEINTPIQYVLASVGFLDHAFTDMEQLHGTYAALRDAAGLAGLDPALLASVGEAEETADLDYLRERIPGALERSRDGLARVAKIVGAMREFGHPPTTGGAPVDINAAIENTLIVAASEYNHVAELTTELGDLPPVDSNPGDINQVLINLIVNASHAIADTVQDTGQRGEIQIRTYVEDDQAVITIADTGGGIPADIADRVFDPFFTTKDVGRGTGQGLSIARAIIDRHNGRLTFDSDPGHGTTFTIRLPLTPAHIPATAPA
jgi:PAS domain S-box-containing protein